MRHDAPLVLDHPTAEWVETRKRVRAAHGESRVFRWSPGAPAGINVAEITPSAVLEGDAVIYPMSFDYRIDPLVLRRLEVLAEVLNRRVIGVETPGVTMEFDNPRSTGPARFPTGSICRVLQGDYRPLALAQYVAIQETVGVPPEGIRLIGESLGAQLVVALSAIAPNTSVDIVEPVNIGPISIARLLRIGRLLAGPEAELRMRYIARNREEGWGDLPPFESASVENASVDANLKRFGNQGRWALLSAAGLLKGLFAGLDSSRSPQSIGVWHARESLVWNSDAIPRLHDRIDRQGIRLDEFEIGLINDRSGHHVLTSLDAMIGFGLAIKRAWRDRAEE